MSTRFRRKSTRRASAQPASAFRAGRISRTRWIRPQPPGPHPKTRQWSIYLVDLDEGTLDEPPVIGKFTGNRGEFYNQQTYKARAIYVLRVAERVSIRRSNGAVVLSRRRQDLGSQLDLQALARSSVAEP